jgi:hypothetical protein
MDLFYVRFYKLVVALVIAIVLTTSLLTLLHTTSAATLLAQPVRSREVSGILPGGVYAQSG